MKQIYAILLPVAVLTGCATTTTKMLPIDASFLQRNLSKQYAYSSKKCFESTLAAFKELKYPIKVADPKEGTIVTDRKSFTVNASATNSGTNYGRGYTSSGEAVTIATPYSNTSRFVAEQSDQYYMKVKGDNSNCVVEAFKWRSWNGAEEMHELQEPGEKWAKQNLFRPFFEELELKLQGKAY
jgi:hypothetical protein